MTGRPTAVRAATLCLWTIIVPATTRIDAGGVDEVIIPVRVVAYQCCSQQPLGATAQLPFGPHVFQTSLVVAYLADMVRQALGPALNPHQVITGGCVDIADVPIQVLGCTDTDGQDSHEKYVKESST